MKFDSLDINNDILKAINDAGFERCTPIQEQSLPETLAGMDSIAQSQTGTGKTAVFLITILNNILKSERDIKSPRALILAPTRELAVQISKEAEMLAKHTSVKPVVVYGGVDYEKQKKEISEGAEIIVATPGRLIDLFKSKALNFDTIDTFVVDEADRMFDMGFAPDVRYIANKLPKNRERQTLLFSATIDFNVRRLASIYMKKDHVTLEIDPEQITVDSITQKIIFCANDEKVSYLLTLLKREEMARVIVFTNMKRTAEMLEWKLNKNDVKATALTGDVSQSKRQKTIEGIKAGTINVLVATDVAARGLHINDVSHVINYDLPEDAANYVHRIGRTARAGATGVAYSLGCEDHVTNLPEIEKFIEKKLEKEWLEDDEIIKDSSGRFVAKRQKSSSPDRSGRGKKPYKKTSSNKPGTRPKRTFDKKSDKKPPFKTKTEQPETSDLKTDQPHREDKKTGDNKPKKPFKTSKYSKSGSADKSRPSKPYKKTDQNKKPAGERKSLDERMELYKNKYDNSSNEKNKVTKKKGLLGKVFKAFRKKS